MHRGRILNRCRGWVISAHRACRSKRNRAVHTGPGFWRSQAPSVSYRSGSCCGQTGGQLPLDAFLLPVSLISRWWPSPESTTASIHAGPMPPNWQEQLAGQQSGQNIFLGRWLKGVSGCLRRISADYEVVGVELRARLTQICILAWTTSSHAFVQGFK